MSLEAERFDPEAPAESRWSMILNWTTVFLLALILTELTTHPAVGAVIACCKFGWGDFRNAIWLRRVDPFRIRGRVCSWFYVAVGLWKIAFTSMPIMILGAIVQSVILAKWQQLALAPVPHILVAMLLTSFGSFTLCGLLTCGAFGIAVRHRVKVWIDNSVSRARRRGTWPPLGGPTNLAGALLVSALVPAGFIGYLLMLAAVEIPLIRILVNQFAGQAPQPPLIMMVVIMIPNVLLGILAFIAVTWVRKWLFKRAVAATPRECWQTG